LANSAPITIPDPATAAHRLVTVPPADAEQGRREKAEGRWDFFLVPFPFSLVSDIC
jgi:hypothetical protein